MAYKVFYNASVEKDLKLIDKTSQKKLLNKIENTLAKNPKELGKQLRGQYRGLWNYRFGDYRTIYKISETEILILVLRIEHRKDVYK